MTRPVFGSKKRSAPGATARGAEGCKMAVRAGVDILDHGTLVDRKLRERINKEMADAYRRHKDKSR